MQLDQEHFLKQVMAEQSFLQRQMHLKL